MESVEPRILEEVDGILGDGSQGCAGPEAQLIAHPPQGFLDDTEFERIFEAASAGSDTKAASPVVPGLPCRLDDGIGGHEFICRGDGPEMGGLGTKMTIFGTSS